MKKNLRIKIFASFLLLIAMLAGAGAVSIYEFMRLSDSVHDLIRDNYHSIEASKSMLDALEFENSGIMQLVNGEFEEGRLALNVADSLFLTSLTKAKNNITEPEESKFLNEITAIYTEFKSLWQRPIVDTDKQENFTWYTEEVYPKLIKTRAAVDNLLSLNQSSLYGEASDLRDESRRAMMPGIVAVIAALVFAIVLNFFITKYFVSPIASIAEAVKSYRFGDERLKTFITTNDEIKTLESSINELLQRIELKQNRPKQ